MAKMMGVSTEKRRGELPSHHHEAGHRSYGAQAVGRIYRELGSAAERMMEVYGDGAYGGLGNV